MEDHTPARRCCLPSCFVGHVVGGGEDGKNCVVCITASCSETVLDAYSAECGSQVVKTVHK